MNTSQPLPEWLTSAQAANQLGVAKKTVARWAEDGHLACGRTPGGHRRYPAPAVAALRRRMELGQFEPKAPPTRPVRPGGQKS